MIFKSLDVKWVIFFFIDRIRIHQYYEWVLISSHIASEHLSHPTGILNNGCVPIKTLTILRFDLSFDPVVNILDLYTSRTNTPLSLHEPPRHFRFNQKCREIHNSTIMSYDIRIGTTWTSVVTRRPRNTKWKRVRSSHKKYVIWVLFKRVVKR